MNYMLNKFFLLVFLFGRFIISSSFRIFPIRTSRQCHDHLLAIYCNSPEHHKNKISENIENLLSSNLDDTLSTTSSETVDDSYTESIMDSSIQNAVKNFIDSANPSKPDINPVDTFNNILNNLKMRKSDNSEANGGNKERPKLDAKKMLEELFPPQRVKDPFDERKVMIKLHRLLDSEDFNNMFRDPVIGEFL